MARAIVLLSAAKDTFTRAAETLAATDCVSEVCSDAGWSDLLAVVRVADKDNRAEVMTKHVRTIGGLTASEAFNAFRSFSTHDLERMFTICMD